MKIPILFLGTGQAVPTAERNHIAMLLQYKNENILIDCGEGTQRQFRKMHLNPCRITRILITHWHGDHVLGLPGLLQTLALNNYSRVLQIYGPRGTKRFIEQLYRIFVPRGKIKISVYEIENKKFIETNDFEIIAISLKHNTHCNGYIFQEKDKIRIKKREFERFKIRDKEIINRLLSGKDVKVKNKILKAKSLTYFQKGRKISFILDTSLFNSSKMKNSDLAIIESTYTSKESELAKRYMHLTAQQAAKIAKKEKIKELILIHLSQRYENREHIILSEAKKIFANVKIAHDLTKVEI